MPRARMRCGHQLGPEPRGEANPGEMHAASVQDVQVAVAVPEADDSADRQRAGRGVIQVGELHGRGPVDLAGPVLSAQRCPDRRGHR